MSTEFIIGTIIGLIGIIPVIIQIYKWVKKPKLSELMKSWLIRIYRLMLTGKSLRG